MVNELFQDAHDGHGITGDGYIAPLDERSREILAELWGNTDEGMKLRTLEKYQLLLLAAGRPRLVRGAQPYQDASSLVVLRNAIAHYQPEHMAADIESRVQRRLRGKFSDNALMAGSGNPWWPSHCLGHGCATWACNAALALSDHVVDAVGVIPNYRRLRADSWKGFMEEPGGK